MGSWQGPVPLDAHMCFAGIFTSATKSQLGKGRGRESREFRCPRGSMLPLSEASEPEFPSKKTTLGVPEPSWLWGTCQQLHA